MASTPSIQDESSPVYFHDQNDLYVLIVDDNPADLYLAQEAIAGLRSGQVRHTEVTTFDAAVAALNSQYFDVCLCDFRLDKNLTGLDLYLVARSHGHDMPFIAMTGAINELVAAETLITAGFDDVIDKSEMLEINLERILRNACLRHSHSQYVLENVNTDKLTGVLNRRGLLQRLEFETTTAARTREPLAVVDFDLKNFRRINDGWGYPVGDKYLKRFALLLTTAAGESGFVGRLAADEFLIGLPGTSRDGAKLLLKRAQRNIASVLEKIAPCDIALEYSVGVAARTNSEPLGVGELIDAAQQALQASKQAQEVPPQY